MTVRTPAGEPARNLSPGAEVAGPAAYSAGVRAESVAPLRPVFEDLVRDLTTDVWLLCGHLGDAESAEDLAHFTQMFGPATRRPQASASTRSEPSVRGSRGVTAMSGQTPRPRR
jgi:hypothetical protein